MALPYSFKIVSTVHTHVKYDEGHRNEHFSTSRYNDIWWSDFFKKNSYLVTPGGYVKKYTYNDRHNDQQGVTVIATNAPRDPNSPAD